AWNSGDFIVPSRDFESLGTASLYIMSEQRHADCGVGAPILAKCAFKIPAIQRGAPRREARTSMEAAAIAIIVGLLTGWAVAFVAGTVATGGTIPDFITGILGALLAEVVYENANLPIRSSAFAQVVFLACGALVLIGLRRRY